MKPYIVRFLYDLKSMYVLYNDEHFVQVAKYCIVQVQVQVVRQNWNWYTDWNFIIWFLYTLYILFSTS